MTPEAYSSLMKDLRRLPKRISEVVVTRAWSTCADAAGPGRALAAERHADSEVSGRVDDFVSLCVRCEREGASDRSELIAGAPRGAVADGC